MNERLLSCIGGVVPPVCTPLTTDREVDIESLVRLRSRLLRGGVAGLFALGSTGEASYLTDAARRQVVELLSAHKAGEALMVGIVETTAPRIVDALDALITEAVDAFVVTGPFYANASDAEIVEHFEYVASRTAVPVLAYNIPVNVGYSLPIHVVESLLDNGVIIGIKDSSPDLAGFRELVAVTPAESKRLYFTGSDALLDCALQVGANGAVAGLANVAPEAFVDAIGAHREGDMMALRRAQHTISLLTKLYRPTEVTSGTNSTQLGSIKTALRLQGVIADDAVSAPMRRSSQARVDFVRGVLADAGALDRPAL